jgi:hypothetical protein
MEQILPMMLFFILGDSAGIEINDDIGYILIKKDLRQGGPVSPILFQLRWQPYLGSEIHGLGTRVDFGRTFKPAPAAAVPWV